MPGYRFAADGDDGGVVAQVSAGVRKEVPAEVVHKRLGGVSGPLPDPFGQG